MTDPLTRARELRATIDAALSHGPARMTASPRTEREVLLIAALAEIHLQTEALLADLQADIDRRMAIASRPLASGEG